MEIFGIFCLWLAGLAIWLWSLDTEHEGMQRWMPTITGAASVLISFVWLPWVHFAPWGYFHFKPDWAWSVLPDALHFLGERFGPESVSQALALLEKFSAMPGRWLIILMPIFNLWVCVVMGLLVAVAVLSLLWVLGSALFRARAVKTMGTGQTVLASLSALFLLLQVPNFDSWGAGGNFWAGLIALIAGARMGWGVWAALIGLLFLILGGVMEIDQSRRPERLYSSSLPPEPRPAWERKVLPLIGAMLLLLSFSVLPWVRFAPPAHLLDVPGWQWIADVVLDFPRYVGLESPPTQLQELWRIFERPELRHLLEWAQRGTSSTGLGLVTSQFPVAFGLRLVLLLMLAVGVVTFAWCLVSLAEMGLEIDRGVTLGYGLAAAAVFVLLLWYLPKVDTLGIKDDFWPSLLLLVGSSRAGIGVWSALIGLVLIATGAWWDRMGTWDITPIQNAYDYAD